MCRLCERNRERHRVGGCVGYTKGREGGIEWLCEGYVKGREKGTEWLDVSV